MSVRSRRLKQVGEVALCALLVTLIALNAFRRMDYLSPDTAHMIRMTDASRSAYVGKNIADGKGYTTNDLPASLIDFYDHRGKLHDQEWVNADRFPFTAYATAALYLVTGSRSETVGILVYNLLCFVAFLVILFRLTQAVFGQRWSAMFAVTLALLHPYTYVYLYLKDADMLLLTVGVMALLFRYFRAPLKTMSIPLALGIGTLLAWTFLNRPNLGAPFALLFGIIAIRRFWLHRKDVGTHQALRDYALREGLALGVAALWLVPFVIHSMSEWGAPLFSANNMYQLPLGTRYGMGTDTWWKYTEPGKTITLSTIMHGDRSALISKFTTSWVSTLQSTIIAFGFELLLAITAFTWLRRKVAERTPEQRALMVVAGFIGFAFILNLAVLPLYGYQHYAYRHYIGFIFPLMWLLAGHAIYLLIDVVRPYMRKVADHAKAHPGIYLGVLALAVLLWNVGAKSPQDGNKMFARTSEFFAVHWLGTLLAILIVAFRRYILRPPWYPRVIVAVFSLVYACYRPHTGIKRSNLVWFPTDERVWTELAKRKGLVSSFALQAEVAWNTGRKNIPVPEWPMHIYSFAYDHKLEVEDVYIESADALINNSWFHTSAPGFEGYLRLQKYPGHFPGYDVTFNNSTRRGYPKYRIKPLPKASTVYTLTDRAAFAAMAKSPDHIELGDPANVIYTPHGWSQYVELEGKKLALATDITRARFPLGAEGPWEDTAITFFLDDRRPKSVDLEVYATHAATYTFYWNLDLYEYDLPRDRKKHQVGTLTTTGPGWQKVHLDIPANVTRKGLNKLGFHTSAFQFTVLCPVEATEQQCTQAKVAPESVTMRINVPEAEEMNVSLMAGALQLNY